MVETLQNLEHVYAKWENKGPWGRGPPTLATTSRNIQSQVQNSVKPKKEDLDRVLENGRRQWNERFNASGLPPPVNRPTYGRRRKRGDGEQAALSLGTINTETLGSFKTAPSVIAATSRVRPFMGRCCGCMAASKSEFFDRSITSASLHNVFNIDTAQKGNFFVRTFAQSVHAWRRKINHKYPDVSLAVLTSPRVTQAIQDTVNERKAETEGASSEEAGAAQRMKQLLKAEQKRARQVMKRMRAVISNRLVRLTGWFLHHFFGRLLNSVVIHEGQLKLLQHATEKNIPIILLPTHRSHLDYILVTWIMYNMDIRPPHVAAGDNLLIPIFGPLMRGLGGYFIRRKIDKYGKKDHIYRAVLHSYMEELLREGESFEVFIEGGRTRSGKPLMPKGGILSVVVDAYNEDVIQDAVLVPISISYDRILDGEFNNEQMGNPKIHETFFGACRSIWKVLSGHYGNVRIDFCQPFSLKEYLQVATSFPLPLGSPLPPLPPPTPSDSITPKQEGVHRGSNVSIYGTDCVVEDMRNTIQGLAEHVIYSQCRAQAVMPSHILSFILHYKFSKGASIAELRQTFSWLRQEVWNHGRDLGFTGSTEDVIQHACHLHRHLLTIEPASAEMSVYDALQDESTMIRPITTLPDVFSLTYYANVMTPIYAMESVIAHAIHVSVDPERWLHNGSGDADDDDDEDNKITVSRDTLIKKATDFCRMLKYEFLFMPSCTVLDDVIHDGIDQLLASEIITTDSTTKVYINISERKFTDSVAMSFACGDSDDEEANWTSDQIYRVNHDNAEAMEKYEFLRSVTAPILECYFILACNLTLLEEGPMPEKEFTKKVHQHLIIRVQTGMTQCAASAALDTLRNGIHALEHMKVLDAYTTAGEDGKSMLALNPVYSSNPQQLTTFISSMQAYRA